MLHYNGSPNIPVMTVNIWHLMTASFSCYMQIPPWTLTHTCIRDTRMTNSCSNEMVTEESKGKTVRMHVFLLAQRSRPTHSTIAFRSSSDRLLVFISKWTGHFSKQKTHFQEIISFVIIFCLNRNTYSEQKPKLKTVSELCCNHYKKN